MHSITSEVIRTFEKERKRVKKLLAKAAGALVRGEAPHKGCNRAGGAGDAETDRNLPVFESRVRRQILRCTVGTLLDMTTASTCSSTRTSWSSESDCEEHYVWNDVRG